MGKTYSLGMWGYLSNFLGVIYQILLGYFSNFLGLFLKLFGLFLKLFGVYFSNFLGPIYQTFFFGGVVDQTFWGLIDQRFSGYLPFSWWLFIKVVGVIDQTLWGLCVIFWGYWSNLLGPIYQTFWELFINCSAILGFYKIVVFTRVAVLSSQGFFFKRVFVFYPVTRYGRRW